MKKIYLFLLLLFQFAFVIESKSQSTNGVIQGVIRIKFKPQVITTETGINVKTSKGLAVSGIKSVDKLNATYSATTMRRVFPYSPKFEAIHMKYGLHLWYEIEFASKASADEVIKAYSKLAEIQLSEVVREIKFKDGSGKPRYVPLLDSKDTKTMPFNDPFLPKQWNYNNTGQTNGTPGADINLFKAWTITHGLPNVIVSVHDQGVQYDHEDLKANMWINQAELNGTTGVDDDGNGYIDDIYGVNFSNNTGTIDVDFHATHVAGTIAAVNGNGLGVCGIAGGSGTGVKDGARIMTCEILGGSHPADIAASYVYAADNGAVISQNSWGYTTPGTYEQATLDGIDYFIAQAGSYPGSPMKGGVVFFAAGNDNLDTLSYPAYYAPVIAVAAIGSKFAKTSYSDYGSWIEISAPGGNSDDNVALGTDIKLSNGILSTLNHNGYGYLDGTSMACPHVSGIAALIISKFGGPTFTNADLRKHLLTGYRDIYGIPENTNYIGKLGVGAIDAFSGLATDNKLPPVKINNLQLKGIAQDFATLTWSAPFDPDDTVAWSYRIIISKEDITPTSITYAKIETLTSRKKTGDQLNYDIQNLLALTKYYFAVQGIDRWGNVSDISNIVSATTNAGPTASFDPVKPALNLYIDVTNRAIVSDSIKIINSGEGLLRWTAQSHNVIIAPLTSRPPLLYPTPSIQSAIHYGISTIDVPKQIGILNVIQHDTLLEDGYGDDSQGFYLIGESNTKIPNSSATRFYVFDNNGFNLTDVDAYIVHDSLTGPVILEIYQGLNIADASLVFAQEVKQTNSSDYTNIKLNEQLYFEKGTYFWVVCHVPAGNLYPLAIALARQPIYAAQCYMSLDVGKSWQKLGALYGDNRVVWAVWANSKLANINKYITLSPDSGVVTANSTSYIKATVDGTNMINGSYQSNLVLYTNETAKNAIRVPVNVTIAGQKPVMQSVKRTNCGGVIVGNFTDVTIAVNNTGLGRFNYVAPNIIIDNPQFTYLRGRYSPFESGTTQNIAFRFRPTQSGNIFAHATLKDANGNDYTLELVGVGMEPPVAVINPKSILYDNLTIGDSIQGQFAIKNAGKYPLDYYIPAFANGSNMESIPQNIQKFGYTTNIDSSGSKYAWEDIKATGIDVTNHLVGNTMTNNYYQIPLSFLFPFYGKNENFVNITKYGVLSFDQGSLWSVVPMIFKYSGLPKRLISGCGFAMLFQEAGFGHVYYKMESDKLIVQYDDCPYYDGVGYNSDFTQTFKMSITFQIVIYDNGNINLYYKNNTLDDYTKMSSLICIQDQNKNDGIQIQGMMNGGNGYAQNFTFAANSTVQFINPGLGLFTNVTNPYGTVMPNDSAIINYKIKTDSLFMLHYTENMVFVTNDPFTNPAIGSVNFNIVNGGKSIIKADTSSFDFGSIYKGVVKKNQFILYNSGKAIDTLISATFDNNYFTITGNVPEILKPERRIPYQITIKSNTAGIFTDTLRLITKNGQTFKIALKGEIKQGPILNLLNSTGTTLSSITKFPVAGATTSVNFKINNTGAADLLVTPISNDWATISEQVITTNTTGNYQWKSSKDNGGPLYNWVEIAGIDGIQVTGLLPMTGPEWSNGIRLPFTFKFYGLPYDTMYVGLNGLISFTPAQDSVSYLFGGGEIPDNRQPNNFIEACNLFGYPAYTGSYPLAGQYYKLESDRIIIEFRDYTNAFGMGEPVSFEILLYKDGSIRMEYHLPDDGSENDVTNQGVIGIENIDGTDGILVSDFQNYITTNMAIGFYPIRPYVIPASQSKDFTMTLSAKNLVANTYADSIEFVSNDPYNLDKKLPVKLVVSGTPQISIPDSIAFGDVLINPSVSTIVQEFQISNSGTANFTLNTATHKLPGDLKIEAYIYYNYNWLWDIISDKIVLPNSVIALQSLKLRVTLTSNTTKMLYDTLILNTSIKKKNGADSLFKIPISAGVYNPPVITTNVDTISLYAQTPQFQSVQKVNVGNLTGGYKLNYTALIDYMRDTTSTSATSTKATANNLLSTNASNQNLTLKMSDNKITASTTTNTTKGFNRILALDTSTVAIHSLGYGGGYEFFTGTNFTAPSDGFNLTHVQTWYTTGDWLNSTIKVFILGGSDDINSCKILTSDVFKYDTTATDIKGRLLTFKLTKNIQFYPNEKFFVVFDYDAAVGHPQGVVTVPTIILNRYMYGSGGTFTDLATTTGLTNYGWFVRAAEQTAVNTPWVILSSVGSGSVVPTKTDTVKLSFDARSVVNINQIANLTIQSNDLKNPVKNVVLMMHKNSAPVFETPKGNYSVNENETFNLNLSVSDFEGDDFTVNLLNATDPLMVMTVTDVAGTTNGGFTSKTKSLKFTYNPDFKSQGIHVFNLSATDKFGNVDTTSLSINVINVNRPPVAKTVDTIRIVNDGKYIIARPSDFFTDPDSDPLSMSAVCADPTIIALYSAGSQFTINPLTVGITKVTFVATDPSGATTTNIVNVKVSKLVVSAVDEVKPQKNVNVYPNPTNGMVNIDIPESMTGIVAIDVYNTLGVLVKTKVVKLSNAATINIDLKGTYAGLYFVKIRTANTEKTLKIIKQ